MSGRVLCISTIPFRFHSISKLPSYPSSNSRLLFSLIHCFCFCSIVPSKSESHFHYFFCATMQHSHLTYRFSRSWTFLFVFLLKALVLRKPKRDWDGGAGVLTGFWGSCRRYRSAQEETGSYAPFGTTEAPGFALLFLSPMFFFFSYLCL